MYCTNGAYRQTSNWIHLFERVTLDTPPFNYSLLEHSSTVLLSPWLSPDQWLKGEYAWAVEQSLVVRFVYQVEHVVNSLRPSDAYISRQIGPRQAIIWNTVGLFSIGPLATNFSKNLDQNSYIFILENAFGNAVC